MENETTTTTTAETGGNPVEETATAAAETPAAQEQKPEGGTLLEGAEQKPEDVKPAQGGSGSLLDDAQDQKPDAKPDGQPADGAPTEEQVKAFTDGLRAVDLGEGVKIDDAALKVMTPELMRLTGNDTKKAEGVVKAYVEYQKGQARAFAERQDAFNRALISQCRERYGEDLGKVVELAKKGGEAVFGKRIWNEMKRVPSFANNPDIVGKLAEAGRRFATDDGKVSPAGASSEREGGDVLHRMYGGVKV